MGELKACPFCNVTSLDIWEHKDDCYVRQISKGIPDRGYDLIGLFNTRPIEDALTAENLRLKKEVGIHKTFIEELLGHATKKEMFKINPHLKEYHAALSDKEVKGMIE